MSVVADQQQRLAAIDTGRSFICEAPAGSGKTELLTQRFLNLLSCVNKPEEILAITFTNKAAAEMRQRIISALTRAVESKEPSADHEKLTWSIARKALEKNNEMSWNLIESPARLQIKTFDSLCASLASALPIHSSYSTPPRISSDPENLYHQAAEKLISSIDGEHAWTNDLRVALSLLDNNVNRLTELMVEMLGHRSIWLPIIGGSAASERMFDILESNLTSIRADIFTSVNSAVAQEIRRKLFPLLCFAGDNLPALTDKNKGSHLFSCKGLSLVRSDIPDLSEETIHIWLGLAELLLTKNNQWRSRLTKNEGFPPGNTKEEKKLFKEKKEELQSLISVLEESDLHLNNLASLRQLPEKSYNEEQKRLLSAVVNLLPILTAFLNLTFKERGEVDFNEVSLKAEAALHHSQDSAATEYTELTLALDYRIQHILVDEFQDSSPSQISLLEKLIDGWEEGDGRTFFCVGDAMQSIYGFRAANVGLFLRSLRYGIGNISLLPLRLSTNFRSNKDVVQWNNRVFDGVFPKQSDIASGAVSYSSSVAFKDGNEGSNISISLVESGANEANCVVDLVKTAYESTPQKSIAILVRDRKTASQLKPMLESSGLRFQAVELESLANNPLILDLLSLTIALINPSDDIAAMSVLRAPWSGLELKTLYALNHIASKSAYTIFQKANLLLNENNRNKSQGHSQPGNLDLFSDTEQVLQGPTEKIDNKQRTILTRVTDVLAIAHSNIGRKSLRDWVEGTWLALGGASVLTTEQMDNAQVFFEMLEEFDGASDNSFPDRERLERSLRKLFSQPGPDTNKNLQIMTIHKSKGLEFDTVIVPGLHKTPPPSQDKLLTWHEGLNREGEHRLLMSAITASGNEKDSIYAHIKNQEKISADHESVRLLYVACTRAKSNLHLVSQVKLKGKSNAKKDSQEPNSNEDIEFCFENISAPSSSSLMAKLWPAVLGQVELYRASALEGSETKINSIDNLDKPFSRLSASYTPPEFKRGNLLEPYIPFYQHDNQADEDVLSDSTPRSDEVKRVVGVVVHKLLQYATVKTLEQWRTNDLEHLRQKWRSLLASEGLSVAERSQALASIEACLKAMADDERARWLLSDDHRLSKREYAIQIAKSGTTSGESPEGEYERRVIDRVIKDGDNLWIIDYKTSVPEPEEDLGSFASKEGNTYLSAMQKYQSGLSKMGLGEARLALYFPFLGLWHELI